MDLEKEFEGYATFVRITEGVDMTPAEITAAITSIKSLKGLFDTAGELKEKSQYATLLRAIADAELAAARLEIEMAGSLREIIALRDEVERLKKENDSLLHPSFEMEVRDDGLIYFKGGLDKPICANCSSSKRMPVYRTKFSMARSLRYWKCDLCQSKQSF